MPGDYVLLREIPELLEVPPQGTLSRVLHRDERIRLVGFAFDAGQELTEHTSSMVAIVQVLTGSFQIDVEEDSADMGPGDWLLMEPGARHAIVALTPGVLLLTLLK